jgi:hypothetical protein
MIKFHHLILYMFRSPLSKRRFFDAGGGDVSLPDEVEETDESGLLPVTVGVFVRFGIFNLSASIKSSSDSFIVFFSR